MFFEIDTIELQSKTNERSTAYNISLEFIEEALNKDNQIGHNLHLLSEISRLLICLIEHQLEQVRESISTWAAALLFSHEKWLNDQLTALGLKKSHLPADLLTLLDFMKARLEGKWTKLRAITKIIKEQRHGAPHSVEFCLAYVHYLTMKSERDMLEEEAD